MSAKGPWFRKKKYIRWFLSLSRRFSRSPKQILLLKNRAWVESECKWHGHAVTASECLSLEGCITTQLQEVQVKVCSEREKWWVSFEMIWHNSVFLDDAFTCCSSSSLSLIVINIWTLFHSTLSTQDLCMQSHLSFLHTQLLLWLAHVHTVLSHSLYLTSSTPLHK